MEFKLQIYGILVWIQGDWKRLRFLEMVIELRKSSNSCGDGAQKALALAMS